MTASTTRRTAALRTRIVAAGAVAVTGALLLTGCGDQTSGSGNDAAKKKDKCAETKGGDSKALAPGTAKALAAALTKPADGDAPLAGELPKEIRDKGVIQVGTDAAYKPMEYKEGKEIVGLDPDLADAMGKKLGVEFKFTNGTFDGLITSMQTGRFDMIMSSMTDTKDRQEGLDDKGKKAGKGVDFVDYLTAGSSILVQKGNPKQIECVAQMCGEKVATQRGTTSHEILKARTKECEKDGEEKIQIEAFDNDDEARVRLKSGGVVADVSDFPVAANAAKSGSDFEVVGDQMESAPYGIAVSKSNTELRDALHKALAAIIKDGSYEKALAKWGVEDGAVKSAKTNSGV